MKFIFKILHSWLIDGSNANISLKIILLEKQLRIKVFSIINLFGPTFNLYHIGFFLFFSSRKYLVDKFRSFGIQSIRVKVSIILLWFNPVQGFYLVV